MTPSHYQKDKRTLQAHFHFSRMPFTKQMWAKQMYDSRSQAELRDGLRLWLDLGGLSLVCGQNGAGKSITLRRFANEVDQKRYEVLSVWAVRSSPLGFLRSLCRLLGLPPRQHLTDMFDEVRHYLADYQHRTGKHPILILDDAEALPDEVLDCLRRLCAIDMDREDHVSVILAGNPTLGSRLKHPHNQALHNRVSFGHLLHGFTLEDTQGYIRFHLERAEGPKDLFSEEAVQLLFNLSQGMPRTLNQLAIHTLIRAAILNVDTLDVPFIKRQVLSNPLFESSSSGATP